MRRNLTARLRLKAIGALFFCTAALALTVGCSKEDPAQKAARQAALAREQLDQIKADAANLSPEQTLAAIEALNAQYPNQPAVLEELGFALSQSGNALGAGFFFEESARLDPSRAQLLLFAAEIYAQQKDWEGVARALQNYVQTHPKEFVPMKKLAQAYGKLNRPKPAVETYLNAVNLLDRIPEGRECAEIGALFQALGNRAQAEQWYLRALEDPKDTEAHASARMGLLELATGAKDWDACMRWIRQLDEYHPGFLDKSDMASIRQELARWQDARTELKNVRFKAPTAQEMLSSIQSREITLLPPTQTASTPSAAQPPPVDSEKETPPTDKAPEPPKNSEPPSETPPPQAAAQPESPPTEPKPETYSDEVKKLVDSAEEAIAQNRMDDALKYYWAALNREDTHADLWNRLAKVYSAQGQHEQAQAMSLEARRRAPDDISLAKDYLAIVKASGQKENYLAELTLIREQFSDDPALTLTLARTIETANPTAARQLYREIAAKAPDSAEADIARTALETLP